MREMEYEINIRLSLGEVGMDVRKGNSRYLLHFEDLVTEA